MFNKGGLERLTQVLRGWARVQKSEVAETPLGNIKLPSFTKTQYNVISISCFLRKRKILNYWVGQKTYD